MYGKKINPFWLFVAMIFAYAVMIAGFVVGINIETNKEKATQIVKG